MHLSAWAGFLTLVAFFLALDLGVFHKRDEVISAKNALTWSGIWFATAMLFNVVIYYGYDSHIFGLGVDSELEGRQAAIQFFTGYVVELSLSVDNIFVIALIFRYFKVPDKYQHRVLFWGILGAVVLRITMIMAGAALIHRFHATIYVFGGILLYTAGKMALSKGDDEFDPEKSRVVRIARRLIPIHTKLDGHNFFTRVDGKRMATPLFLVLLVVEATDVVFAVDSIPAIFAVTRDPFIVFTSNIFAILGLRSLYFALASMLSSFPYLKHSLVVVLGYVGVKMIISGFDIHIPAVISLGVIVLALGTGVVASIIKNRNTIDVTVPPRPSEPPASGPKTAPEP